MNEFVPFESMAKALDALINDVVINDFSIGVIDHHSNEDDEGMIITMIRLYTDDIIFWSIELEHDSDDFVFMSVECMVLDVHTSKYYDKYDKYSYVAYPNNDNELKQLERIFIKMEDSTGKAIGSDLWDHLRMASD